MYLLFKLILAVILALSASTSYAAKFQSHDSIKSASIAFLSEKIPYKEYKITVSELDRRLQLPECSIPLQAFTHTEEVKLGRSSIGIRCSGKKSWTIYNPVKINAYKNVLVVSQPIRRGQIIHRNHLTLQKKDISRIKQDYYSHIDQAINQQTTRNLATGTLLRHKHLTIPYLIKRGQKIVIAAQSPAIDIQMGGLALMNGMKGQRIRVKNTKSNRILEATVVNQGMVLVEF